MSNLRLGLTSAEKGEGVGVRTSSAKKAAAINAARRATNRGTALAEGPIAKAHTQSLDRPPLQARALIDQRAEASTEGGETENIAAVLRKAEAATIPGVLTEDGIRL
jgi:hypothetical protein